jgi:hypothetical protein
MNNAMVTMPLSEVDAIRNLNQQLTERVNDLDAKQKMIKVEVRQMSTSFERSYLGGNTFGVVAVNKWQEHPHAYINMDEVIFPIREEEKAKLQSFIDERTRRVSELENERSIIATQHKEEIQKLKAEYEQKIKTLTKMEEENTKDTIIASLRNEVSRLTLLMKQVMEQGFWARIFKPINVQL